MRASESHITKPTSLKGVLLAFFLTVSFVGSGFVSAQPALLGSAAESANSQQVETGKEKEPDERSPKEASFSALDCAIVLNAGVSVPASYGFALPSALVRPEAPVSLSPVALRLPRPANLLSFYRVLFRQYVSPRAP